MNIVWTSKNLQRNKEINVGTVMRNPAMLKFVPDHLKTKKWYICR